MIQPQSSLVLVHVHRSRRGVSGLEFCGVVEGVADDECPFKPGDEVCGTADELFANYVCVESGRIKLAVKK